MGFWRDFFPWPARKALRWDIVCENTRIFVARFWHIIWTRLYNLWSKGVRSLPRNFYFTWKSPKDFQWMKRRNKTFPSKVCKSSRSKKAANVSDEPGFCQPNKIADKDFRQCLSPSLEARPSSSVYCYADLILWQQRPQQQSKIRTRRNTVKCE